jgi:hypothetical protein
VQPSINVNAQIVNAWIAADAVEIEVASHAKHVKAIIEVDV